MQIFFDKYLYWFPSAVGSLDAERSLYALIYNRELEYPWILVFAGVLETILWIPRGNKVFKESKLYMDF